MKYGVDTWTPLRHFIAIASTVPFLADKADRPRLKPNTDIAEMGKPAQLIDNFCPRFEDSIFADQAAGLKHLGKREFRLLLTRRISGLIDSLDAASASTG